MTGGSKRRRRPPPDARPTVGALLTAGVNRLRAAGVDNARAEAGWLLAHAVGLPRAELVIHSQRPVTAPEAERYQTCIARRARREPLQYILGTQPFCGLEFVVDARVLIPRPETELLVKRVAALLSAGAGTRTGTPPAELRVADVGTGSGCIAVALARKLPGAEVDAIDVSAEALEVARLNVDRHGVADRVRCVEGDVLRRDFTLPRPRYDAIVSNPPYVSAGELRTLQPEVLRHEPLIALAPHPGGPAGDPGEDPLVFYRRLGELAASALEPGGLLAVELAAGRAADAAAAMRQAACGRLGDAQVSLDENGIARVVVLFRR